MYERVCTSTVSHTNDFDFKPPFKNSRGEDVGPTTQEERIAEWNAIEDKYGVKIYIDVLPRLMANQEFKRRVEELYSMGARRIALWDTFTRTWDVPMWNLISRFGHRDEIADMPLHEEGYGAHKFLKVGKSVFKRYNPMWGG